MDGCAGRLRPSRSMATWLPIARSRVRHKRLPRRQRTKFDVPDATRRAILFTKYALDVRLETRDATMHVRANS